MKIAICDDDLEQLNNLSDFINLLNIENKIESDVVFLANSYKKMEEFIDNSQADLYILDIDLKDTNMNNNGYVLAEKIRKKSNTDIIIFQTGLLGYIHKGYDVNAFQFLTKPLNFDILEAALIKAYALFKSIKKYSAQDEEEENFINVKFDGILYRFKLEDIVYVEKLDMTKIKIKLKSGKQIESILTLSEVEDMNQSDNPIIVKTHKSFLCNLKFIDSIDFKEGEILMDTGDKCLLGRTFRERIKYLFMKGE